MFEIDNFQNKYFVAVETLRFSYHRFYEKNVINKLLYEMK